MINVNYCEHVVLYDGDYEILCGRACCKAFLRDRHGVNDAVYQTGSLDDEDVRWGADPGALDGIDWEVFCAWCEAPLNPWIVEERERALLVEARGWISDCEWGDDVDPDDLDDDEVRAGVERHYDGGWDAFVADAVI